MAATVAPPTLINGYEIKIDAKKEKACKAVVQVELNGGTVTLTPRAVLRGSGTLDAADYSQIEYWSIAASSVKLTGDISASGVYEFYIDEKTLILTASAVTGNPRVHYALADA